MPDKITVEADTLIHISPHAVLKTDTNKVYIVVEQMPVYPGGEVEMNKFISSNLIVPAVYEEMGVQGRLSVRFIVSKTGEVKDIRPINDNPLNKYLIEVIEQMPRWTPGKQNGEPVDVYYTIPMNINLKK